MTSRNHPISSIESLLHVQPFIEGDPETDVFVDQPDHADNQQALNALTGQGGRLFGGITLGQSLNAAQQTVSPGLVAHSMHCTFVSGRLATVGVQYHIERVKDGRQFCARLVRAVQNRRTFFLALVNFANVTKFSTKTDGLQYGLDFPHDVAIPPAAYDVDVGSKSTIPFLHHSVGIRTSGTDQDSSSSSNIPTRIHQWVRAREPISDHNGPNKDAHLAALACMSDAYLLAGAPHTHGIYDFVSPAVSEVYDGDHRLSLFSKTHQPIPRPHLGFPGAGGGGDLAVTSMASLDHSLYFHDPVRLRADQWLLCEIHSSWAGGGGRALVHMKIWGRDGTLVASCSQEGLVSLGDKPKESKL